MNSFYSIDEYYNNNNSNKYVLNYLHFANSFSKTFLNALFIYLFIYLCLFTI